MKKPGILFLINTICLIILIIFLYTRFCYQSEYFLFNFSTSCADKFFITGTTCPNTKEWEMLNSYFKLQDIIYHGSTIPKPVDVEQPFNYAERELGKLSKEELWRLYLKNFDVSKTQLNVRDMDHYGYIYGHPKFTALETRQFSFERCFKMFPEMIRKDSDTQRSLEVEKGIIWKKLKFLTPPPPWDRENSNSTGWMKRQNNWYQHAQERWALNKQIIEDQYKNGVFPPIFPKDYEYTEGEKIAKAKMMIAYAAKRLLLGSKHGLADDILKAQIQMSKWDEIDDYYGQLTIILIIVFPIIFFFCILNSSIKEITSKYFYEVSFLRSSKLLLIKFNDYLIWSNKPHTEEYKSLSNDAVNEIKRCRELQAYNMSPEDLKILLKKLSAFLFYCSNHPFTHEQIDSELLAPLRRFIPLWSHIADYNDFFKKKSKKTSY